MSTQKHVLHQLHFKLFLRVAHAAICSLRTCAFLQKFFFCRSVPIIHVIYRHKFRLTIGTERQKNAFRKNACVLDE